MGLEHIHSETHQTGQDGGLKAAAVDAWSPANRGALVSAARQAFNGEAARQAKECIKALVVTGPTKAVQGLGNQLKAAGDVISVIPDDFEIICESIYDKPAG